MVSQHPDHATDPARHSAATAARALVHTHPWWGPDHAYGAYDLHRSAAAERLAGAWAVARFDGPVPHSSSAARNVLLAVTDSSAVDVDMHLIGIELLDLFDELEAAWPSITSEQGQTIYTTRA